MKQIFTFLLITILLFSCNKTKLLNVKTIDLPSQGKDIVEGANNYGFEVFKKIVDSESDQTKNIMYSPLSLNSVFSMLYNGAKGTTSNEMQTALGLDNVELLNLNETYKVINNEFPKVNKDIDLNIANSIWGDNSQSFNSDFSTKMQDYFKAEIQNLDFSDANSLSTINDWVKNQTKGKIEKIVNQLDFNFILINALYFKGQWHYKFDKSLTQNKDFYLADSSKILAPMMQFKDTIRFATSEKYIIAELPYSEGNFVMDLILPQNDNTTDSIISILQNFSDMAKDLTLAEIKIYLPRFEFKYQSDKLTDIIKEKMPTAFGSNADFSGMLNTSAQLSKVIQKTYIKTDEDGTTAVAVSSISGATSAEPPAEIHFNKPFIFIIREVSTNTVMFIGKVSNPNKSE